jgi:hypothetical protein
MYFNDAVSVSAYYAENSYGALRMSGTVVGPYVVTLDADWNRTTLANDADATATARGVNLGLYSRKVYILPKEADANPVQSGWGGSTSRADSRIWIRDYWCSSRWVAAHNVGHHLGLRDASTPADAYGDFSTPMGGRIDPTSDPSTWNDMPHFNAAEKIGMGWFPSSAVQTVEAGGNFRLASVERAPAPGQVQVLRIRARRDGAGDYYVSYRERTGFSTSLSAQYAGLTSITFWDGTLGSPTCLLATLADGQAFADASGLMVAQRAHDAPHADIVVTFGTAALSDVPIPCA